MEFDDLMEPEVGVAVGVTAAIASPSVRRTLRKGAVYGLAGLMMAGDAAMNFARSVGSGIRKGVREGNAIAGTAEGRPAASAARSASRAASKANGGKNA